MEYIFAQCSHKRTNGSFMCAKNSNPLTADEESIYRKFAQSIIVETSGCTYVHVCLVCNVYLSTFMQIIQNVLDFHSPIDTL